MNNTLLVWLYRPVAVAAQRPPLMDNPTKVTGGAVPADYVPRMQFEEKIQECLSKEETIQVVSESAWLLIFL